MHDTLSEKDAMAIQDILIEQLEIPRAQITPQARLKADLGADSLDIVEIGMKVEERFEISLPDEELEADPLVGDLYAVVSRLGTGPAAATVNKEATHGT
jgi:acyl carrier protein